MGSFGKAIIAADLTSFQQCENSSGYILMHSNQRSQKQAVFVIRNVWHIRNRNGSADIPHRGVVSVDKTKSCEIAQFFGRIVEMRADDSVVDVPSRRIEKDSGDSILANEGFVRLSG